MRSQVKRTIPGVSFEQLTAMVRTKLVTSQMPPQLAQMLRSRDVFRANVQQAPPVEDWLFATEINPDVLPEDFREHLVRRSENMLDRKAFVCHESWHIEQKRATVEMSSGPAGGAVIISLRIDIVALPESQGIGCDIDSRLYTRCREHGMVLPIGLVEKATEAHHIYSENLRDIILAVVAANPSPDAVMPLSQGHAVQATPPHHLQASGCTQEGTAAQQQQQHQAQQPHQQPHQSQPLWPPAPVAVATPGCEAASAGVVGCTASDVAAAPARPEAQSENVNPQWGPGPQGPPVLKESMTKDGGGVALDTNLLLKVANAI
jgi:hypothetical protein